MTITDLPSPRSEETTGSVALPRTRWTRRFGFGRLSIVYVELAAIVLFVVWVPNTFATYTTVTGVLSDNAITGLVALALVFPLAAGVFDLSVGLTLGATSIFCAWLLGNTHLGIVGVVVVSLLFALAVGVVNGIVVVVLRIDSFIGTLATGSLLQSAILIISNDQILTQGVSGGFLQLGQAQVARLTPPVFVMFGVALVLWYVLGHTATGRRVYACGLGPEPARLAGIRVSLIRFVSLLVSSLIAGIAGVLVTAVVTGGSPSVGPSYLIPAFAAAFLGATQFRDKVFNAWGTVLAVLLLGTLVTGLALAGAPLWMPSVFQGVVLIVALALGSLHTGVGGERLTARLRRLLRRPPAGAPAG